MTLSLLDAPGCLDGAACDVGPPAATMQPVGAWQRVFVETTQRHLDTAAFRRRATAECLDTLATLRAFREPLPNETWETPYASECRALAQVNALVGLGPASLQQVAEQALDPDLPDPGRVYAALLTLGCVSETRWLTPLRELFVASVLRGPTEAAAAVEALALAAQPTIAAVLRPLLAHQQPGLRAAALRVLSFRRELAIDDWLRALTDADPQVVVTAAGAPLAGYDPRRCEHALAPLLDGDDEARVRAALHAGLGIRLRAAYVAAKQRAQQRPPWAESLVSVAAFGFPNDAGLVRAALEAGHVASACRAAGLLGDPTLVPDLIACAHRAGESGDPQAAAATVAAAAGALQAISGLDVAALSPSEAWARRWAAHAAAFEPGQRYRLGRPLTIAELLNGLAQPDATRARRQCTYLELMAATEGAVPRFDVHDFVAVQRRALRAITAWLAAPGAPVWPSRALH